MSFGLNQQVLWRRCRGLVNSPLALVLYISTCVLVRSTSFMAPLSGIEEFIKSIFRRKKEILIWTF